MLLCGGVRGQNQTQRSIMHSSLKVYLTEDYNLCGREIAACPLSVLCLFQIRTIWVWAGLPHFGNLMMASVWKREYNFEAACSWVRVIVLFLDDCSMGSALAFL